MDNKVTKKRINDHLEYDWYKYLIIILVGAVLFYFVFSQINRTRDYEDVNFFVSCYESGENSFSDRVLGYDNVLGEMKRANYDSGKYGKAILRSVAFEPQDPLGSNYSTLLQTHGNISSDVLILGEKLLKNLRAGFLEITDEMLTDYILPGLTVNGEEDGEPLTIDDLEYYDADLGDGRSYRMGIKVSKFANLPFEMDWRKIESYKNKFAEAEEEDQPDDTFYLVINTSSVNIGKYGKKEKYKDHAQVFYLINRFIKYYRVKL